MYPKSIDPLEMFECADDFTEAAINAVRWTSLDDGSTGTNLINAVSGGEISLVTAAAANDYHLLFGPKCFLPAKGKPIWFETRFKAGTSAGMQYFGLSSDVTATVASDTTGIVNTSFSGAMFFCLPAGLSQGFVASNAAVQTSTANLLTLVAAQTYQAGFHWDSGDGTTSYVKPWIYDETAKTLYQGTQAPVLLASLAQMAVIFGVKSASAAETLKFDYVRACQKR